MSISLTTMIRFQELPSFAFSRPQLDFPELAFLTRISSQNSEKTENTAFVHFMFVEKYEAFWVIVKLFSKGRRGGRATSSHLCP